jgi:hypothetical protein
MYLISICIPSITERITTTAILINKIQKQIDDNNLNKEIQLVCHMDNRSVPLIYKRNILQSKSKGKYFMHLDDDDDVSDDYIIKTYNTIKNLETDVDVITYDQLALVGKNKFKVICDLNSSMDLEYVGIDNKNKLPVYKRYPWQWCLWNSRFKNVYRSDIDTLGCEDPNWIRRVKLEYPKTQKNIPHMLHTYNFQDPTKSSTQSCGTNISK